MPDLTALTDLQIVLLTGTCCFGAFLLALATLFVYTNYKLGNL